MDENITNKEKETTEFKIQVDDGAVRVPITNKNGEEIGVFYFQPTDVGIVKRFADVSERFAEVVAPLENIGINNDGTGVTAEDAAAIQEAEDKMYELCDYLFGGNMSAAFFGKMNPFSPVNGNFYCENALNAVAQFVSDRFNEETKKVSSRIDKYTHGIRTGRHKGGRQ